MTLDEARAHIGNPVLAHDYPRLHEGVIVSVEAAGRVRLRLRRKRAPYNLLPNTSPGWHPSRLTVPDWWLRPRREVGQA